MPYDTMYYGLLQDRQRKRAEKLAAERAGAESMAAWGERQNQQEERKLDMEARRAELAYKYAQISGMPVEQQYSGDRAVQQSSEVGRLEGEAYGRMQRPQQDPYALENLKAENRAALERQKQEGALAKLDRQQQLSDAVDWARVTLQRGQFTDQVLRGRAETTLKQIDDLEAQGRSVVASGKDFLGRLSPRAQQQLAAIEARRNELAASIESIAAEREAAASTVAPQVGRGIKAAAKVRSEAPISAPPATPQDEIDSLF